VTEEEFFQGLKALGTSSFEQLTRAQVHAFTQRLDKDGNGQVSLVEFMQAMGQDYSAHLALKLKRLLEKAEELGASLADCFAKWDVDGGGSISTAELEVGLRSLPGGVFGAMSARDMTKLMKRIDADGSGEISLPEIYDFIGRDYSTYLEDRVRQLLLKVDPQTITKTELQTRARDRLDSNQALVRES
jgi:Ca2+-binding EF-hand superfamily protein